MKEGELEVTILSDSIASQTKTFLAGVDYSKANGWLIFKKSEAGGVREGFMIAGGVVAGSDSFTLDMSGDLIVETSFVAAALIIIVPIVGVGKTWSRYERQSN